MNTLAVFSFLYGFLQKPKHFKDIFTEKKRLINVTKTDEGFITCNRAQPWHIRILTKDNLKKNLVNKNFQTRVPKIFPAPYSLKPPLLWNLYVQSKLFSIKPYVGRVLSPTKLCLSKGILANAHRIESLLWNIWR